MYNLKRFIFQRDLDKRYMSDFNKYAIDIMYGDNIIIGDNIEDQYKDDKGEEE